MFSDTHLVDLRFGPFEGSGVAIVGCDELVDGLAQLSHTGKLAPRKAWRLKMLNQIST